MLWESEVYKLESNSILLNLLRFSRKFGTTRSNWIYLKVDEIQNLIKDAATGRLEASSK